MKGFMLLVGFLLFLGGIGFGLWAGVWWAFIGGFFDIIKEIKAEDMQMLNFGLGFLKIIGAGVIGWVSGILAIIPGVAIIRANC